MSFGESIVRQRGLPYADQKMKEGITSQQSDHNGQTSKDENGQAGVASCDGTAIEYAVGSGVGSAEGSDVTGWTRGGGGCVGSG